MKPFVRADRVSGEIKKVLSMLLRKEVHDPRLEMATITSVKMSRDLRIARIYFISSNKEMSDDKVIAGFQSASGYLKRTLASKLGLRYMPALEFYFDDSYDYGSHIENLIRRMNTD